MSGVPSTTLVCTDCQQPLKPNARRKGTRCAPCTTRVMAKSPEKRAKVSASMKARLACPHERAAHRERCTAGLRKALATRPELLKQFQDHGRRIGTLYGGAEASPAGSPARQQTGRKRTEYFLGWCPLEYRPLYTSLRNKNRISAAEARRVVELQIAHDLEKYQRTGELPQTTRPQTGAAA